jgi:hypothetical protein
MECDQREFTVAPHVLPGDLEGSRCLFSLCPKRRNRQDFALAAGVGRTMPYVKTLKRIGSAAFAATSRITIPWKNL